MPGHCLIDAGPDVGRFLVEGSHTIHFEPAPDLDQARFDFVFAHAVLAAIHRHRGDLVLHANTLRWRHGLLAIAGSSGAGKSTTAAGLIQRGATLIADDLTVLRAGHHDQLVVRQTPPQLHLTRLAAERLGLSGGARPSPVHSAKVVVSVEEPATTSPPHAAPEQPWSPDLSGPGLHDLVLLEASHEQEVRLRRLHGADLFLALQHCIYGPLKPCDIPASFPLQALLARRVRVWSLKRPQERWCLDEVLDALEDGLAGAPTPIGQDCPASAESHPPQADG